MIKEKYNKIYKALKRFIYSSLAVSLKNEKQLLNMFAFRIIDNTFGEEPYSVKEIKNKKNDSSMNTYHVHGDIENDGIIIDLQVFKTADDFLNYYNGRIENVNYVTIKALVDTGAERTAISNEFINKLELDEIGTIKSIGFGNVEVETKKYKCLLYHSIFKRRALPIDIVGNQFSQQPYNAILGRDFLVDFTLIYDGWSNSFRLINVKV